MKHFFIWIFLVAMPFVMVAQENEEGERLQSPMSFETLKEHIKNFPRSEQERILAMPEQIINSMQFQRSLWFAEKNYGPDGAVVDREELWREAQPFFEAERAEKAMHTENVEEATWKCVGPFGHSGRILALEIHPSDNTILFAGSAGGGLWKSTSGGSSWVALTDFLAIQTVDAIAINRTNPNEIYFGTGENSDGGLFNYNGIGLYYTRDGGSTWTKAQGLNDSAKAQTTLTVTGVAINPANDNIVFASIGNGNGAPAAGPLFKSIDKGVTWNKVTGGLPAGVGSNGVLINPANPNIMYLNVSATNQANASHGVWKSVDAGATWAQVSGLPPGSSIGKMKMALCYTQPNVVCAFITNSAGSSSSYYLSLNDGTTWTQKTVPNVAQFIFNGQTLNQGTYDLTCGIKGDDPNILFIGGITFAYSTNQGSSWTNFPYHFGTNTPGQSGPIHPDQQSFAVSTNPANYNLFLLGNDGGVFSATTPSTWTYKSANLVTMQYYSIDIGHTSADFSLSYGGTQDNGAWRVTDPASGSPWNTAWIHGGDAMYAAVDYTDGCLTYQEQPNGSGLSRSDDCGQHWQTVTNGLTEAGDGNKAAWSAPLVTDPSSSDILWWGGQSIFKTEDGANDWANVRSSPEGSANAHTIAVAPSNHNFVMVGYENGHIQLTTDGGATWTRRSPVTIKPCSRVAFDPLNHTILYCTYEGPGSSSARIFKSVDTGRTWASIIGNFSTRIPVHAIVIGKEASGATTLYIGTDMGVFTSSNDGTNWVSMATNMGNQYVHDLKITPIDPATGTNALRAGTHGRGIWETSIPLQTTVGVHDDLDARTSNISLDQNYPNPFSQKTTIRFELARASHVTLTVSDMLGRVVKTLVNDVREGGIQNVRCSTATDENGSPLPNGVYTYRLSIGGETKIGKMIVTR